MDLLTKYRWLWVIVAMIFVCVLISLIFLLINKCISRGDKHKISRNPRASGFSVESNKYQETNIFQTNRLKDDVPPLPPRTQFLTAEAQSYENLTEVPDYEQSTPEYEQDKDDNEPSTAVYEECTSGNVQDTGEYEQSMPDYVKVEEEETILPPPPPYNDPDPAADNASSGEDYDDIGGDETQGEEDYDDVG